MFDLYPRHGHRSPQQIAEDAGGSFEPTRPARTPQTADAVDSAREESPSRSDDGMISYSRSRADSR